MKLLFGVIVLACTMLSGPQAGAQAFPSRPLHLIVPYPPGGAADIDARLVAQKLAPILGQPVIVENKAGASGNIGAEYVAKAAPDGYTLLLATSNIAINPAVTLKLPFDVLTDFAPVTTTLTAQNLLAVRPSLPVKSVRELIAYAKANPGKLTFGTSGVGSPLLAMELLKSLTGVQMVNVPYKGDGPAIVDLLGGQIDMYATNISAVAAYHRSGKLRGLAVTSMKRAASLPDVPTMAEAGVPGYDLETWFGILAPAKTPRSVVDQLNAAIVRVIAMPDVQKQMLDAGLTPYTQTPEEFGRRIQADVVRFGEIVKKAGIQPE